jgi:hypothetical protein
MKGRVVDEVEEVERKICKMVVGGKQISKVNGKEYAG